MLGILKGGTAIALGVTTFIAFNYGIEYSQKVPIAQDRANQDIWLERGQQINESRDELIDRVFEYRQKRNQGLPAASATIREDGTVIIVEPDIRLRENLCGISGDSHPFVLNRPNDIVFPSNRRVLETLTDKRLKEKPYLISNVKLPQKTKNIINASSLGLGTMLGFTSYFTMGLLGRTISAWNQKRKTKKSEKAALRQKRAQMAQAVRPPQKEESQDLEMGN